LDQFAPIRTSERATDSEADSYQVGVLGACLQAATIFLDQKIVTFASEGRTKSIHQNLALSCGDWLATAQESISAELDLRFHQGVGFVEDARIEIRDCQGELSVRFGDEQLEARGHAFLDLVRSIEAQWFSNPALPARGLILSGEPGVFGQLEQRPDLGLHELFSKQADRTPSALAIVDGARRLSYGELDAMSDRLAVQIAAVGIEAGETVAAFMQRGAKFCVAILGILKSGAAYLPIDPEYPRERHVVMLEDSGCSLVLASHSLIEEGLLVDGMQELIVDLENLESGERGTASFRRGGDAAYVIFTSGSTGRPKGVVNTHRGVVSEVLNCIKLWGLVPEDRVPQFASISFDTAVEEIWSCWLAGAQLVITPPDVIRSHSRFMGWVRDAGITVLDLPTAFWHSIVAAAGSGDVSLPEDLKLVVVGGEFARASAYLDWKILVGDRIRWVNTYGPTEAAIACLFYCDWIDGEFSESVPIGLPVPNSVAYVVDADGRALPDGFTGELWIGGDCVAQGYVGRPELTAERFIDDPFSNGNGGRVYKTGDLVWVDQQGRLRYVGRRDRQVKVRGFRIELDEVEEALNAVSIVDDAAVKVIPSPDGDAELTGYISPQVDVEGVLGELIETLPAQMVPSRLVVMEELPKTNNGKIDYKALQEPEPAKAESEPDADGQADPIVETVLEEMRDSVNGPKLRAQDNFFASGGHSLRMMELLTALERRGLNFSPDEFLRKPTAEGLAETVRRRRERPPEEWSPLKPLREVEGAPVLILPHSTPGDVMGYGNLIDNLGPGISCYGLVARGTQSGFEPHDNLEEMASYYVGYILDEIPGPYHLCGWCFGGMLAFEIAHQLLERGEEVGRLILIDTEVPPMPGLKKFRALSKLRSLARFPFKMLFKYYWVKLPWGRKVSIGGGDPHVRDTEVYRTNEVAYDRYEGRRYPGTIDEITSGINLWDGLPVLYSEDLNGLAAENFTKCTVDGSHMTLMREPVVAQVAERIRTLILPGS